MEPDKLSLYESRGCPYCIRVRRFLEGIGESVESRDTMMSRDCLMEMVRATGSQMVPCLKIEAADGNVRWLHESADIIDYLRDHFQTAAN